MLIVSVKRPSGLEDEGKSYQADELLKMNTTDKGNLNKNTTAPQVYIAKCVCACEVFN